MEASKTTGRFAPTPSGDLHLGNLLCALLAFLSAKAAGGQCLLRIEDTDLPRCPQRNTDRLLRDLDRLGFEWDGEILYQSRRQDIYAAVLKDLEKQGAVYPCFCTRAQLHQGMAPNLGDTQFVYAGTCRDLSRERQAELSRLRRPAIRLRVPEEVLCFQDGLCGTQEENLAIDCGDFILRRSDGLWGYQLASVVDDALSGVNQIVRGRDILSSTPRQLYLQRLLGYSTPAYYHIPLLTDHQGRRLAKRDRDLGLEVLLQRFSPGEIRGILAFSCGLIPEPLSASWQELITCFDWSKVCREDIRLPAALC